MVKKVLHSAVLLSAIFMAVPSFGDVVGELGALQSSLLELQKIVPVKSELGKINFASELKKLMESLQLIESDLSSLSVSSKAEFFEMLDSSSGSDGDLFKKVLWGNNYKDFESAWKKDKDNGYSRFEPSNKAEWLKFEKEFGRVWELLQKFKKGEPLGSGREAEGGLLKPGPGEPGYVPAVSPTKPAASSKKDEPPKINVVAELEEAIAKLGEIVADRSQYTGNFPKIKSKKDLLSAVAISTELATKAQLGRNLAEFEGTWDKYKGNSYKDFDKDSKAKWTEFETEFDRVWKVIEPASKKIEIKALSAKEREKIIARFEAIRDNKWPNIGNDKSLPVIIENALQGLPLDKDVVEAFGKVYSTDPTPNFGGDLQDVLIVKELFNQLKAHLSRL